MTGTEETRDQLKAPADERKPIKITVSIDVTEAVAAVERIAVRMWEAKRR